jgi:hypothetical protein
MWSLFGDGGTGVRLKFRLAPKYADLRSIQYEQASRTILNELNHALHTANEPPFVPWTISRIAGFYLPSTLSYEGEVRLMVKRHKGGRDDAQADQHGDFWPVPIGIDNDICRIDLREIDTGPSTNRNDVMSAIAGTSLETVPAMGI